MRVACHVALTPGRLAVAVLRKAGSPVAAAAAAVVVEPTWPTFQSPGGNGGRPASTAGGAGGYGDVLDASAVDEETVFAILLVVGVDERCQQLDVAVFGGFHGGRVLWERSGTGSRCSCRLC